METLAIESSWSFSTWIWIVIGCLVGGYGLIFLCGGFVDIGAASIEHPRTRRIRLRNGMPAKLVEDLLEADQAMTDDDVEYQLTTFLQKSWPAFGVETNTLPVFGARDVGEIPIWQIQKLLHIGTQDLATSIDLNRWRRVHDHVTSRLHKVALVLNARREALAIAQGDAYVPEYLKPAAHTELRLPVEPAVVTGSLHA